MNNSTTISISSPIAIIGDVHMRGKDFQDKKIVLNQLRDELKERGVKYLFNTGDLFDNYGKLNDKYITANTMAKFLYEWLESQPDLCLISQVGNHDIGGAGGRESAFDVFQHPQQLVVRDRVKWVGIGADAFVLVPWISSNGVGCDARMYAKEMIKLCYNDIVSKGNYTSINILMHADCVGAQIRNSVSITSEEYSPYTFDMANLMREGNMSIDNILTSHIHQKQEIKGVVKGYAGYIGYLTQLAHGEAKYNGYTLFDPITKKVTFHTLAAPRYYTLRADNLGDTSYIQEWDRVRVIGQTETPIPSKHVEMIGESLSLETVKDYINKRGSSFDDVFKEWCELTEVEMPEDRAHIDDFLSRVNIKWESLTGKLDRIDSIELHKVGPHNNLLMEFGSGFTAIEGRNSAGKSFSLEAFPYICFGDWITDRGVKAAYLQKDSKAITKFTVAGVKYIATRTMTSMVVTDEFGVDLTKTLKRSSREFLENILGERDNFLHCCFVDQKNSYDLIDCDPSSRMQMLRYFLKLDVFDDYHKEVKEELTRLKYAVDTEVRKLERLEELEGEVAGLELDLTRTQENLQKARERNLESKEQLLASKRNEVRRIEEAIVGHEGTAPQPHLEDKVEASLLEVNSQVSSLLHHQAARAALQSTLKGGKLESVGCAPNYLPCPLIDNLVVAKERLASMEDRGKELKEAQEKQSVLLAKVATKKAKEQQRVAQARQLTLLKNQLAAPTADVLVLTIEVTELKALVTNLESVANYRELEKESRGLDEDLNMFSYEHGLAVSKLKNVHKELLILQEVRTSILPALRLKIASYEILEKAFNKYGIAHYLASSALPELQEIFNSLVNVSFEGRLQIAFDNITEAHKKLKESFSILKTNALKVHDVRYSSPGEQSVLRTLWKLTLLVYQTRRNEGYRVLFLDEPTAGQDQENVEATMRLLKHVSSHFDQVLFVTHDENLAQLADHRIQIGS
jgi:DNA repair exonuclease SbcCD ATPase subunit